MICRLASLMALCTFTPDALGSAPACPPLSGSSRNSPWQPPPPHSPHSKVSCVTPSSSPCSACRVPLCLFGTRAGHSNHRGINQSTDSSSPGKGWGGHPLGTDAQGRAEPAPELPAAREGHFRSSTFPEPLPSACSHPWTSPDPTGAILLAKNGNISPFSGISEH